jgi:kynureninase
MNTHEFDARDPLRGHRAAFRLPHRRDGEPYLYLCGNSLGPEPVAARERVAEVLEDWAERAVLGHHEGARAWLSYHEQFAASLARIVGAKPSEVVLMNTLTVNLHLMLVSFYRPTPARPLILLERGAFPSDRYAFASQVRWHGLDPREALLELAPRPGRATLATADVEAAIREHGPRIALVCLPGVQYLSGQRLDIPRITQAARAAGCAVGWDLAHSAGNVPLECHAWDMDFAVWCTYKYLCGGPGAIAGAFVHERHAHARDLPRLAGWWGHDKDTRFQMGPEFVPITGAEGWQLSNGPVLSMAPLLAALALYDAAGMAAFRAKSLALVDLAHELIDARLGGRVECLTPREHEARGCQLSLRVPGGATHGRQVFEFLKARGVIGDWREPDVVRVAPHPLYNSYTEVESFVTHLAAAVAA